jgi:hypothetical protein
MPADVDLASIAEKSSRPVRGASDGLFKRVRSRDVNWMAEKFCEKL